MFLLASPHDSITLGLSSLRSFRTTTSGLPYDGSSLSTNAGISPMALVSAPSVGTGCSNSSIAQFCNWSSIVFSDSLATRFARTKLPWFNPRSWLSRFFDSTMLLLDAVVGLSEEQLDSSATTTPTATQATSSRNLPPANKARFFTDVPVSLSNVHAFISFMLPDHGNCNGVYHQRPGSSHRAAGCHHQSN